MQTELERAVLNRQYLKLKQIKVNVDQARQKQVQLKLSDLSTYFRKIHQISLVGLTKRSSPKSSLSSLGGNLE